MTEEIIYNCSLSDLQLVESVDSHSYTFHKVFAGKEFYLKENVLGNLSILPGAAYIEMASAAYASINNGELPNRITHTVFTHIFTSSVQNKVLITLNLVNIENKPKFWRFCLKSETKDGFVMHAQIELAYVNTLKSNSKTDFSNLLFKEPVTYSKEQIY